MTRASRDDVGILVAADFALRGTCARRKVGCILVDEDFRSMSSGYNGPASKAVHCIDKPCPGAFKASGTGLDLCEALHAEANAVMYWEKDVRRIHTCYTTVSPCVSCVKMLLGTGCQRIVFAELYPHAESEAWWLAAGREWIKHIPLGYASRSTAMSVLRP